MRLLLATRLGNHTDEKPAPLSSLDTGSVSRGNNSPDSSTPYHFIMKFTLPEDEQEMNEPFQPVARILSPKTSAASLVLNPATLSSCLLKTNPRRFPQFFFKLLCLKSALYNGVTKRKKLIRYLVSKGAFLVREGGGHSIYQKDKNRTAVPRHTEIVDELARKICQDLEIPFSK
jgi:mRNA interferase HicA